MNEFIESISNKISDYRNGEIGPMNAKHVKRWINQFQQAEQKAILEEIDHLLDQCYLSKEDARAFLRGFVTAESAFGQSPASTLRNIAFLDIQTRGSSQREMLELMEEILEEEFQLPLSRETSTNTFLYVDDCIYTGNRLRYDVVDWIQNLAPNNATLIVYHYAHFSQGFKYAQRHIRQAARAKNIKVKYWYTIEFNNSYYGPIEFCYPKDLQHDPSVYSYFNDVNERCITNGYRQISFRSNNQPTEETFFSHANNRDTLEKAFLREGTKLVHAANNPSTSMRPLGFQKLESLGFGALFFTYRNVANNCPLVLWYGDPDHYDPPHPFSQWYPLFPRKSNEQTFQSLEELVEFHD